MYAPDIPGWVKKFISIVIALGWVKTTITGWVGHTMAKEDDDTSVWLALLGSQFVTGKFVGER